MTLKLNIVNLAWEPVTGSSSYDILLDGTKVAQAGPRAKTTKINIPEGAEHKVTIKAQPSGQVQEAKFEWGSVTTLPPPAAFDRHGMGYLRLGSGEMPVSHTADYDDIVTSWGGATTAGASTTARRTLVYMSMLSVKSGAGGAYHFGVTLEQAQANNWLLKDAGGNNVMNVGYGYPAGDFGDAGYQAQWCANVSAKLTQWGVDGIFIDDVLWHFISLTGGVTPVKYPTQPAWYAAVVDFCQAIYAYFQPLGKFVSYNAGAWYSGANDDYGNNDLALWTGIVPHCDGLMSEKWVYHQSWPNEIKVSPIWDSMLRLPQLTEANGKVFMCLCGSARSSVQDWQVCSMLLETANGTSYWTPGDTTYSNFDRSLVWHPLYDRLLTLGEPTGAKVKNGSRWERRYAGGLVWVDPTAGTAGIV